MIHMGCVGVYVRYVASSLLIYMAFVLSFPIMKIPPPFLIVAHSQDEAHFTASVLLGNLFTIYPLPPHHTHNPV